MTVGIKVPQTGNWAEVPLLPTLDVLGRRLDEVPAWNGVGVFHLVRQFDESETLAGLKMSRIVEFSGAAKTAAKHHPWQLASSGVPRAVRKHAARATERCHDVRSTSRRYYDVARCPVLTPGDTVGMTMT